MARRFHDPVDTAQAEAEERLEAAYWMLGTVLRVTRPHNCDDAAPETHAELLAAAREIVAAPVVTVTLPPPANRVEAWYAEHSDHERPYKAARRAASALLEAVEGQPAS